VTTTPATRIAPEDRAGDGLRAIASLAVGFAASHAIWFVLGPLFAGALPQGEDETGAFGAALLGVALFVPAWFVTFAACCYAAFRLIQRRITAVLWLVAGGWALLLAPLT
jgi:hypothetical protein